MTPHLNTFRTTSLLLAACLLAGSPSAQPSSASPPAPDEAPAPRVAPLLAWALGQVASAALSEVSGNVAQGLFKQLKNRLSTGQGAPGSVSGASAAAPVGAEPVVPVVGYAIDQLDPQSFAVVQPLELPRAGPVLRTGDVFALRYSTNLPGQVRLENIDPTGTVADLGTYTVLPDQLNRIPRDLGIKLVGQPGVEVVRFYFYPCLPAGVDDHLAGAAFKGRLPDCGRGPNPVVQAAASGSVRPKALVNLEQPDRTLSFAGVADYRVNDITSTVALIRHEAR